MATEVFIYCSREIAECNYSNSPVIRGTGKGACGWRAACFQATRRARWDATQAWWEGGAIMEMAKAWFKRAGWMALSIFLCASVSIGQQLQPLNLMPIPAGVELATGSLKIDSNFTVGFTGHTDARLFAAAQRFTKRLGQQTGLLIGADNEPANTAPTRRATLLVRTDHDSKAVQELGEDESYALAVQPEGAVITAPSDLGALHGLQTFLQLVRVTPDGFVAPAIVIKDTPRFPWRGLMIDTGRHFIPLEILRRNIDGMEAVKMNVFHWHLSEDQGFRVESKKFPKLQENGSDGLYYTQEEIRGLIEYARDRGIRVVPEFDVPGHSTAWFVGHPELSSGPGPYEVERKWGVFDPAMDPTNEKVFKFLDEFIGEMAKLFPDQYFHVGGDEVNGKQWDANPRIQAFIREHGLAGNAGLQLYFNKKLQAIVSKHGKSMVGWDEVLDPTLPKDIVIQSWRGQAALAKAAREGYRGLLSNGYYLDLGWSAARHYAVDPLSDDAAALSAQEKQLILGGESCMWSEYVNEENIDSRIWPRNAAIAERLWSREEVRDPASMYSRLHAVSAELEFLGLTHLSYYERMLRRIAGPASAEEFAALKNLADVLEPVKDYTREETAPAPASSKSPLIHVVDAVRLESRTAREFSEAVDKFVVNGCRDDAAAGRLRAQLTVWRDNDAKLEPLATRSFLVKEVATSSQDLSSVATAGLAALDAMAHGGPTSETWKAEQLAVLQHAETEKGQLLLLPVAAIQKLVEAAASSGGCAAAK
jgi:hexosaminidase